MSLFTFQVVAFSNDHFRIMLYRTVPSEKMLALNSGLGK